MKDLTSAIDLTAGIRAARPYVASLPPGLAAMNAAAFAVLSTVFLTLSWYFDYDSTMTFIHPFAISLTGTLPATLTALVPWVVLALTVSPTVIELFLPAIAQIRIVAFILYGVIVFDALTDYPRVELFLAFYEPSSGWVEILLWKAAHAVMLFFGTVGFEFCFALCTVVTLMCIGQAAAGSVVKGTR
jgi:hypothetical protein